MTSHAFDCSINLCDVVRRVFPKASDKECDHLLWSRTGYPGFWRTGHPERDILHSLRILKRTESRGHQACDFCSLKAVFPPKRPGVCRRCDRALSRKS